MFNMRPVLNPSTFRLFFVFCFSHQSIQPDAAAAPQFQSDNHTHFPSRGSGALGLWPVGFGTVSPLWDGIQSHFTSDDGDGGMC